MLDLKRWQASYSVGNWVLDNQHRLLLVICDDTIELVPEDLDEPLSRRFQHAQEDLLVCIDEHFKTEERLLKNCSKALYERHYEEHCRFRKILREKLDEIAIGSIGRDEFRQFMTEWWSNHILHSDKGFSQLIQRVH